MSQFGLSNRFQTFEKNADLTKACLSKSNNYLYVWIFFPNALGLFQTKKAVLSVFFYSRTTVKSYTWKASSITWSFVGITQIEMVTLCDLAGLPESLWLHRASSKTKLKKRKERNFRPLVSWLVVSQCWNVQNVKGK